MLADTVTGTFKYLLAGRRYVRVFRNGNINDVVQQQRPADDQSSITFEVSVGPFCGTPTRFRAAAMTCGSHSSLIGGNPVPSNPAFIGYSGEMTPGADSKPSVGVSLEKGAKNAFGTRNIKATIEFDFKQTSGKLTLALKSWTDADGQTHPGSTLQTWPSIPNTSSPVTHEFSPPSGARQVLVVATAEACGKATAEASIECGCEGTNDPVYFADGNVRVTDVDPLPMIAGHRLVRTYNSDEQVVAPFGRGWTTPFERRMILNTDNDEQLVSLVTASDEVVTFRGTGSTFRQTWPTSDRAPGTLVYDSAADTYAHRAAGSSEVAVFRVSDGRLVALRDLATGHEAQFTYDTQGLPQTLTDSWSGTSWNLTADTANRRVASIVVSGRPDLLWSYAYDANGNLLTVTAPGGSPWRTYAYSANRMTASYDGAGNLIESHTYDADGYGISSTGPGDEIASIAYNLPGSVAEEQVTRVTYKTGATADYALRPVGGAVRVVRATAGCASCGAGNETYVHDVKGRVVREQGGDGYVTMKTYTATHLASQQQYLKPVACDPRTDTNRCRLGPDALAGASLESTAETITTSFQYDDPLWPDKATVFITPSVHAPGQERREVHGFDPTTGVTVTTNVRGWSGDVPAEMDRVMTKTLYGAASGLTPAFDPGGSFDSAWLVLAQPAGLPRSIDGPRSDVEDVTQFVYYPIDASVPALLRGRLAAIKNAAGHMTRYEAYDVFENATPMTDPNGVVRESSYDTLGRAVTSAMKGLAGCDTAADPLCATDLVETRSYASAGLLQTEERAGGGVTSYAYDSRGRLQSISRGPALGDPRERIETTYDALTGRKNLERTLARESGTWVEKKRESFSDDARGLLQRVTHADGAYVEFTYDRADRVSGVRDENHPLDSEPNTVYEYSPAGRLELVTQKLLDAPLGIAATSYGYDIQGNLTRVIDPNGNMTSYLYDDFGQLVRTTSPVTGATMYQYDAAGQLAASTDANGATTTRTYDALGRALTATSSRPGAATEVVSWTYDTGTFATGRISSMTDPAGDTTYAYERRGLLREETRTFPDATFAYTTAFQNDRDGNRTSIVYPSTQLTVAYTFDYAGRPTSAGGFVAAADYLPFGPLTRLQFANGTIQTFEFDTRYRMTKNQLAMNPEAPSIEPLVSYNYGYDAAGNVTSIIDPFESAYDRTFEYDDLNRLVTANTGSALWGKGKYRWDAMGNLLAYELGKVEPGPSDDLLRRGPRPLPRADDDRLTAPRGRTGSIDYVGATPKLASVTTNDVPRGVQYDAAGNETSYFATRTYSARNLLGQVTDDYEPDDPQRHTLTYSYDGRGVRSVRAESPSDGPATVARSYFLYSPELRLLSATRDDSSNVWSLFGFTIFDKGVSYEIVWFGDRPVAQVTPGGAIRFTFADHLGTPILQTDAAANITWRVEYEPFGNVYEMREGNRTEQPLRFPGQEAAMTWEGAEENYNIFRWYRAGWGRYTQADPIGLVGGENLYRYARANPLTFVDRGGLSAASALPWALGCAASDGPFPVGDIIGLAILGAAVADEAARGECNKCGNCTPAEHALLQSSVNQNCKGESRKCTAQQDLQTLQANLAKNVACALARDEINNRCYGGGDAGHRNAANEARGAAANCLYHLWKLMEKNPNFIDPSNP
jgi:RHS repeat-associated protein